MADIAPIGAAFEGFTRGFVRARQEAQERETRVGAVMLDAAKADPSLFDDPNVAKAITTYVGGKEPFELLRTFYQTQSAPGRASFQQAQALGVLTPEELAETQRLEGERAAAIRANAPQPESIPRTFLRGLVNAGTLGLGGGLVPRETQPAARPLPNPYATAQQALVQRGPARGATVTMTPKGGTSVSVAAETPQVRDERAINFAVAQRMAALQANGLGRTAAMIQATREVAQAAMAEGRTLPRWAQQLAFGDAENQIKLALAEGQKQIEAAYAGQIAAAGEIGRRSGALAVPMQPEEFIARDVRALRTPEGAPIAPEAQTAEFLARSAEAAGARALATSRGTAQAQTEARAREQYSELQALSDALETFVPAASTVLATDALKSKSGMQRVRLWLQSGTGDPGIAALTNLQGLIPRFTRAIGGDVGALAVQEQKAYETIVNGTWQTDKEFVTNMLVLALAVDKQAMRKAQLAGLPVEPGASRLYQALQRQAALDPAVRQALARYRQTFRLDAQGRPTAESSAGAPAPTRPAEAGAPIPGLPPGFSVTIE